MLNQPNSEIYIPDGMPLEPAIARTTHLAIGAHQDDLEIMAVDGILQCFNEAEKWFAGVIVTDGRSAPRSESTAKVSDEAMMKIRNDEQKCSAAIGNFGSLVLLGYPSSAVKEVDNKTVVKDLIRLINLAKPKIVYTHNPTDKHSTHIAVLLRTIEALRQIKPENQPLKIFGCEAWRDLDWLPDRLKVLFDCSEKIKLQKNLLKVFDSQIRGGKRYDLAAMGRRVAHATFYQSHHTDKTSHLSFGMDLTPLITNPHLSIEMFTKKIIQRFETEVLETLRAVS